MNICEFMQWDARGGISHMNICEFMQWDARGGISHMNICRGMPGVAYPM